MIFSKTFLLYALNPLCESEIFKPVDTFVIPVIVFIPIFLYFGILSFFSRNLEPIQISDLSSIMALKLNLYHLHHVVRLHQNVTNASICNSEDFKILI